MGCSPSKLEKEEAVQLCKDRRKFIKQAVEQRERFALGHINYIQSLRRVSFALLNYVEGNEHHNFFSDRYSTPPFTPEKRTSHDGTGVVLRSFESTPDEHAKSTTKVTNYFRPQGNPSIPIEEWPESPETVRVESYYHSNHDYVDGFFVSEASGLNSSFSTSPYNSRPSYPPTSPQDSQWDYFWNPFSTLDQYRYQFSNNPDEEMGRINTVRKEEGLPELEEVEKDKEDDNQHGDHGNEEDNKNIEDEKFGMTETKDEDSRSDAKSTTIPISVENFVGLNRERKKVHELKECQSQGMGRMEVSEAQNVEAIARNSGSEETPDFTVYVNRRPASMVEVMKDIENQFVRVFDSAREVSVMLEASRYIYSTSNEPTGNDETASNYSEECCMKSGSHQSTLDRLYSWEKKLYEEVKCCERVRIAYEKKCKQLRNHDINGAEPSTVDKTRAAIRDLHTQLTISLRSVESVSRRIETLRQEELYPQLVELMQGLARMWKTMADCHKIQKRTIDEAKLLLFSSSSISMTTTDHAINPRPPMGSVLASKAAKDAANLLVELRNWRYYFAAWIGAQRSYAHALAGWALECTQQRQQHERTEDHETSTITDSSIVPPPPPPPLPIVELCLNWSSLVDSVSEGRVSEGIDIFAAGIKSVMMQQKEGAMVSGAEGAVVVALDQSMTEVRDRVLCAGMSKVMGSLTEFACSLAGGYEVLARKFEEEGRREGRMM